MTTRSPFARTCSIIGLIVAGLSSGPGSASIRSPKALMIAIDGLRPDAMEVADTPAIDTLIAYGSFSSQAQCESLTFSGPNWTTILHGVHWDKHQVTSNGYENNNLARWPDVFHYLELRNPDWNTFRILTWDVAHRNQPTGADVAINREYSANGDERAKDDIVQLLTNTHPEYPQDPDAIFMFFSDVDTAGHRYGFSPDASGYLREIEDVDRQIDEILAALIDRPNFMSEDWLVVITSDHGGAADGSHSGGTPEKRTIPFITAGLSLPRGDVFPAPKNVDLVTTTLAHMGVPILREWGLDGHLVGLEPSRPRRPRLGDNLIYNGDGEYDRGFGGATPDQAIAGWNDPGPDMMTLITYDAGNGYPTRDDPGPDERGDNFFCGGLTPVSRITQTIDISRGASLVDRGRIRYHLSGYLGGYASQDDRASFIARFLDADGVALGEATVGPVFAADRGNQTGLVFRETMGAIPPGARSIEVELKSEREDGSVNDGYADNLSLVLTLAN